MADKYTLQDWQKLELERHDQSYKRPPAPVIQYVYVQGKTKTVPAKTTLTEDAKKIYFNAGRFMAGARDRQAATDYKKYQVLEGLD